MPTLNWIGKDKVLTHHTEVPYRVLDRKYTFGDTPDSGNMIIHGDNLEALKSLLPRYEDSIKCIYIDPPYNTGNEGWVYNDNVNDPHIQKWLGDVFHEKGITPDDLTRHDKWCCMIYPRLYLLSKLLSRDGVIFISIDDNEVSSLKFICDEIFGATNAIAVFPRRTINSGKHDANTVTISHDYVVCYAKNRADLRLLAKKKDDEEKGDLYKLVDEYVETRGRHYVTQLNKNSLQYSDSLNYPIIGPDGVEIWPGGGFEDKQWIWRWSKEKLEWGIANGFIVFKKPAKSDKYKVYTKSYEFVDKDGNTIERTNPNTSLDFCSNLYTTFNATPELERIMDAKKVFDYPKPVILIQDLLRMVSGKDFIVLDSFAGSGTTAHAVLNLNKVDGGRRKFILCEMGSYAEKVTAERVSRVMKGYGEGKNAVEGTGGSFDFYELGETIFDPATENLNDNACTEQIKEYVWYSETHAAYVAPGSDAHPYLLGTFKYANYYFYYIKGEETCLDWDFLKTFTERDRAEAYIIYADRCVLTPEELLKFNITFKKIPRDIKRV